MSSVRISKTIAQITTALFLLAFMICPAGLAVQSDMPFNGEIAFHNITITIPNNYIRDSIRSTDDLWVFEKAFYSKYIMLSRKDIRGNTDDVLDNYVEYLKAQGMNSQRDTFMDLDAVRSGTIQEANAWHEMLFAHDGSLYAVAIRGGSEDELQALLKTISIHDGIPEIVTQPDKRTPIERIFGYFFGS